MFDGSFLTSLGRIEVARGLITSLISIGTIGIGIVIVSVNYTSQGEEKEVAEKFNRGKDVLTIFIGIFGTIVGYYFGSNNLTASTTTTPSISPSPSVTTAPLISPSPLPKK